MSTTVAHAPADEFRVRRWDDYIGQAKLKRRLNVAIQAAHTRGDRVLDPILLTGPPGCGKTSLGQIVADELMKGYASYMMPIDERTLIGIMTDHVGVVLLDEIHRASTKQQEQLLPLLEDKYVQFKNGRIMENPYLTIIGASTEQDKIIKPLYDRFMIRPNFEPYTDDEMAMIAFGMAERNDIAISEETALGLAKASGGTPRHMRLLLTALRDLSLAGEDTDLDTVLDFCHITEDGLTEQHVDYLLTLSKSTAGMGLSALADHLGVGQQVVRDLESLLRKRDLVEYTKGGRLLTPAGFRRVREMTHD